MGECVGECKFRNKEQIPNDALCVINDVSCAVDTASELDKINAILNRPRKKGRFRILELT
jgi:hypothetical protein